MNLRTGFTTGSAAAAAAKAASLLLFIGEVPDTVDIPLPTGGRLSIPVHSRQRRDDGAAVCTVIKDGGDDPDVTHGAEIGARVRRIAGRDGESVEILGGTGVGRVTRPGLDVPPGEPAINPVPRRMIRDAVAEAVSEALEYKDRAGRAATDEGRPALSVEIFVPEGERLAAHTLNARLGILGGISILGTTGIVTPLSHDAYIATIRSALSVAAAAGIPEIALTTGRRSEKFVQALWPDLPEAAFIQMGDFFQLALEDAAQRGFRVLRIAAFFGKAVKMASGVGHTHAAKSSLTLATLAEQVFAATGDADLGQNIREANTARHAFEILYPEYPAVVESVGRAMRAAAQGFAVHPSRRPEIRAVILDFEGRVVFDSHSEVI